MLTSIATLMILIAELAPVVMQGLLFPMELAQFQPRLTAAQSSIAMASASSADKAAT